MKILHSLFITSFLTLNLPLVVAQEAESTPTEKTKTEKTDQEFHTPKRDRKKIKANSKYVEGLPNVLIIGDSISIGYTPHVIEALEGKANIFRIPTNGGNTQKGLDNIEKWLKTDKQMKGEKWNVIHFNWGLHDLCYRNPKSKTQGKRDKETGTQDVSIEHYEKNLEKLVIKLKETKAKLIWAHTTLVPEKEAGRILGDDKKYNAIAEKIMQQHSIQINDLNEFSQQIKEHFVAPGNVHFTEEGSKQLGVKVAKEISKLLLPEETK